MTSADSIMCVLTVAVLRCVLGKNEVFIGRCLGAGTEGNETTRKRGSILLHYLIDRQYLTESNEREAFKIKHRQIIYDRSCSGRPKSNQTQK